jgi:hypothetical protein
VIDFLDQFLHAAKRSPTKSLLRDAIEPDFHLIEPGGIGWSEVSVEPWPRGEPASNSQMLVCSIKVEVKEKHISFGWTFSCFAAHLIKQDLF